MQPPLYFQSTGAPILPVFLFSSSTLPKDLFLPDTVSFLLPFSVFTIFPLLDGTITTLYFFLFINKSVYYTIKVQEGERRKKKARGALSYTTNPETFPGGSVTYSGRVFTSPVAWMLDLLGCWISWDAGSGKPPGSVDQQMIHKRLTLLVNEQIPKHN